MAEIMIGPKTGLKPCPFCGSELLHIGCMTYSDTFLHELQVDCLTCGAHITFTPKVNEIWADGNICIRRPIYDPVGHWNARAKEDDDDMD